MSYPREGQSFEEYALENILKKRREARIGAE